MKAGLLIDNFDATKHADEEQRNQLFEEIQEYFKTKYKCEIDRAVKDIFRLCFISYDPNMIINENAVALNIDLNKKQKQTTVLKSNSNSVKIDDKEHPIVKKSVQTRLENISDKLRNSAKGDKHMKRFRAGVLLGEIIGAGYVDDSVIDSFDYDIKSNTNDFRKAKDNFTNGVEEGKNNPFYIEIPDTDDSEFYVKNKPKPKKQASKPNGKSSNKPFTATTSAEVSAKTKQAKTKPDSENKSEEEFDESKLPFCFWYENLKIDKKTGEVTGTELKIDQLELMNFLSERGYLKAKINNIDADWQLFGIDDNIIRKQTEGELRHEILNKIFNELPYKISDYSNKIELKTILLKGINSYINPQKLDILDYEKYKLKRDEYGKAFIYFKNGFAEITKEGVTLKDYSELDGVIWESSIIDKKIEVWDSELDHNEVFPEFDWYQFLELVCSYRDLENNNEVTLDQKRFNSLINTIGYLIHNFSIPTERKAVIMTEDNIEDTAEGRAGKSLIFEAIGRYGKIRNVSSIDGRSLQTDNQFMFQNVAIYTDIIFIDDAKKNFKFETLFSMITQGFEVEKKGQQRFKFDPELSPKVGITTNYMLKGVSGSHRARKHNIELLSYFNDDHSPEDEFGGLLFNNWDEYSWNGFYNIMFWCVKTYFQDGGLKPFESETLKQKQIMIEVGRELYELLESEDYSKGFLVAKELVAKFKDETGKNWSNTEIFKRVKAYCEHKGYSYDKKTKRIPDYKTAQVVLIIGVTKQDTLI